MFQCSQILWVSLFALFFIACPLSFFVSSVTCVLYSFEFFVAYSIYVFYTLYALCISSTPLHLHLLYRLCFCMPWSVMSAMSLPGLSAPTFLVAFLLCSSGLSVARSSCSSTSSVTYFLCSSKFSVVCFSYIFCSSFIVFALSALLVSFVPMPLHIYAFAFLWLFPRAPLGLIWFSLSMFSMVCLLSVPHLLCLRFLYLCSCLPMPLFFPISLFISFYIISFNNNIYVK